jgi:hypothetical protein
VSDALKVTVVAQSQNLQLPPPHRAPQTSSSFERFERDEDRWHHLGILQKLQACREAGTLSARTPRRRPLKDLLDA